MYTCIQINTGVTWYQINYQEGGDPSVLPLYSSQEWSKTVVNAAPKDLGMWGASMVVFNTTSFGTQPGIYVKSGLVIIRILYRVVYTLF
jgi:hypothetical protein